MSAITTFEKAQIKPDLPAFEVGDTVRVSLRIKEGDKERLQPFEGQVISIRRHGSRSSFIVRKISYGVGVERIIPFYTPVLESLKVVRHGDVRRAKLYYLREKTGKAARIREKQDW